jgi:hypothetical protein
MATASQFFDQEDCLQDKDDPLYWQIRREFEETQRRQHWYWHHYHHGTLKSQPQRELQRLAREAEQIVAERVQELGYLAYPTTHKCPFDLWVEDYSKRAVRVEVKISLYHLSKRGGRYQADIRRHDQADLLVFIARNGQDWPFVIPMVDVAPRRHIAIWSYCPADYSGQWAIYLEAWDHLHRAIAAAEPQARQLSLFD